MCIMRIYMVYQVRFMPYLYFAYNTLLLCKVTDAKCKNPLHHTGVIWESRSILVIINFLTLININHQGSRADRRCVLLGENNETIMRIGRMIYIYWTLEIWEPMCRSCKPSSCYNRAIVKKNCFIGLIF